MLDFAHPQLDRLKRPAFDRDVIYLEIGSKWGRSPAEVPGLIERVPDHAKRSMSFGAGITYGLFHIGSLQVAVDKCAAIPERWWPYCRLGIGCGVASSRQWDSDIVRSDLAAIDPDARAVIEVGAVIGHIWYGLADEEAISRAADAPLPVGLQPEEEAPYRQFLKGHLLAAEAMPRKSEGAALAAPHRCSLFYSVHHVPVGLEA
ncbi:MAG: hypothetical protein M5R36_13710 [Deltaproteobacteria bacterium]|nr:hypothetical protein [Deltaproteobacteria bacterium]